MAESIRKIKETDFQEVSTLFNNRKSIAELKWLYTDPDNTSAYNAYVAVNDEGRIVGIDAYILSYYKKADTELLGVTPITWMVTQNYKGMAGISLFKKVSQIGEFGIEIGGSEIAQTLYPLFKYKKSSNIGVYYKILNLWEYYNSIKGTLLLKKIKLIGYLLPSYFHSPYKYHLYENLTLTPYINSDFNEDYSSYTVFGKKITKNYINWLMKCPLVKILAFDIKKENEYLGVCILYIQNVNGVKRGRIIHIPFLGFDKKLWHTVINKCSEILKKEKCCFISAQAHHEMCRKGYNDSGFINIKTHSDIVYIRNLDKKIETTNLNDWHLQFTDGDKFYRNI